MRYNGKAYKAVFCGFDGAKSSIAMCHVHDLVIDYVPGEFAVAQPKAAAQGYHPTVFSTYKEALTFCLHCFPGYLEGDDPLAEIWLCECEGINPYPPPSGMGGVSRMVAASENAGVWPAGTMMAERVKLVRKMTKEVKNEWTLLESTSTNT